MIGALFDCQETSSTRKDATAGVGPKGLEVQRTSKNDIEPHDARPCLIPFD